MLAFAPSQPATPTVTPVHWSDSPMAPHISRVSAPTNPAAMLSIMARVHNTRARLSNARIT